MGSADLPVVIVGAGPVGLAAAAHLLERGLEPLVLEAGPRAGAAVEGWSHVRMFSPWSYNVDKAAARLLARHGWTAPDPEARPTGRDLLRDYIEPLAHCPEIAERLRLGSRVTGIARHRLGKVRDQGRAEAAFAVRVAGAEETLLAGAVIDASGTWSLASPAGADGLAASGETRPEVAAAVRYGIPDILGRERERYAGRTVAVLGSGHSAIGSLLELAELARSAPGTRALWLLRRSDPASVYGGGERDRLDARGALGSGLRALVDAGRVEVHAGFLAERLRVAGEGLAIDGVAGGRAAEVRADQLIVATGFRPDLSMLSEVRLDLDPALECPRALAPLIDPNVHSCGTVRPHGAAELTQPEPGFFIAGMKSYGRAPTFLLATGHEQVRSIAAHLAGDEAAARQVQLELPETGVCSTGPAVETAGSASGCCGGPAPAGAEGCCRDDAAAKAAGLAGCGCSAEPQPVPVSASACC